jgi:hypothetical protein
MVARQERLENTAGFDGLNQLCQRFGRHGNTRLKRAGLKGINRNALDHNRRCFGL